MWVWDVCIIYAPVNFYTVLSGYLFVCPAVCRLCLERRRRQERREKKRGVLEEGRAGGCLSYSQHESRRKSLATTIEFLLYLPGIFFHLASEVCHPQSESLKERPRQTTLSVAVTNMQ